MPVPVLDAAQATEWDARARSAGTPGATLMERAGQGVATVIHRAYPDLTPGVVIAAGRGNNGGDGWVAARVLAVLGTRVSVAEVTGPRTPDCETHRARALEAGVTLLEAGAAWPPAAVVVDALLGTGAQGPPRDGVLELAERAARHGAPIVAVDGPTGLDLSTGEAHGPVRAAHSVTFGGVRRGHLFQRDWCGRVSVLDIGFPSADASWPTLVDDVWAAAVLPRLNSTMHKGDRGKVLVIGGAEGMSGAALHAVSGAFAAGAGLVKLASSPVTIEAARSSMPDALTVVTLLGAKPEPELRDAIAWADAVVLGPGLGRAPERATLIAQILDIATVPVLLDADALHLLPTTRAGVPCVLTPHGGEFRSAFPAIADLADTDRFAAAAAAAAQTGATVLLKGVPTVVASPDGTVRVSASGNAALATGGSGDVLSGLIGAFLARRVPPEDAATLGAHALGRAAELAAARRTARATRPGDVLDAFPDVWRGLAGARAPAPPVLLELEPPALV
jgi:NAD(P)H-hydrate epimerase